MKKIILGIFVLFFMISFAFTSIKVKAEEVVEENETIVDVELDTPVIDESAQDQTEDLEVLVEDKTKEITTYVISLVVAFLGSSAFYAIVKAIISHVVRVLKDKISELEKQNQINQKSKEMYEAKIEDLENTLVNTAEKVDVVLEKFIKHLEIDEAKQKQAADLLQKLLPPIDNNDNKKEGE